MLARVRALSCVNPAVARQATRLGKPPATDFTLKWTLSGVDPNMITEMALHLKRFATVLAFMWSFRKCNPGVLRNIRCCTLVIIPLTKLCEGPVALLAVKRVYEQVFAKGIRLFKGLRAMLALETTFIRVCSNVNCQVIESPKVLVATRTRKLSYCGFFLGGFSVSRL